jgi:hypothetical protein
MLYFTTLCERPACFRAFTGLTVEEFQRLVALIRVDWIIQREERLAKARPQRERKEGGGAKSKLPTLEDQLLLTLTWSRLYPVYLVLEFLFGVDESTVSRTIAHIQPLLQDRFLLPERLPCKKIRSLDELKKFLPPDVDLDEVLVDATEQKILRPEKKRRRKPYHSGKKLAFTVKTQIAVNRRGIPVHVSPSIGGRRHDYRLFQHSGLPRLLPDKAKLLGDLAYEGARKDYPRLTVVVPFRKYYHLPPLNRSQKIWNKRQRRVRITVEHTIAQLKTFKVLAERYRHSLQNYNQTFRLVANLVAFRMLQRQT